jgi:hypothetical protein
MDEETYQDVERRLQELDERVDRLQLLSQDNARLCEQVRMLRHCQQKVIEFLVEAKSADFWGEDDDDLLKELKAALAATEPEP